jgi:hypothetical protein
MTQEDRVLPVAEGFPFPVEMLLRLANSWLEE